MDKAPVLIAEQLLEVVKRAFSTNTPDIPQLTLLEAYESKHKVEDLCSQLLRSVLGPLEYTTLLAESCQESSALGFVTQLGVADLLGDKEMSIQEISETVGVKTKYLKVAMSCVAKHGYFDEIKTETPSSNYRNNDLSNVLRECHPSSLKDAIGFMCDEGFKASCYLLPASKLGPSQKIGEKEAAAINLAFGFEEPVFEWFSREAWRGKRMGSAMQQLHRAANENTAFDYNWPALASPVVDVGGGVGSLEMILLRNRPEDRFEFIIFDLAQTTENAREVWAKLSVPDSFSVSFQPGDFMAITFNDTFLPTGKATYIIRHVFHNWSDEEVVHILKHVRTAMLTGTTRDPPIQPKLILCDTLLHPGSNRFVRAASMQIMAMSNGWTRTETDMIQLLDVAGFSYLRTHRMRADDSIIEAAPTVGVSTSAGA